MAIGKFWRVLFVTFAVAAVTLLGVTSCGDTDGSSASEDAGVGTQFVADGGAGGSIAINVSGSLTVAGTTTFSVRLLDPRGAPIAFARIFCESENGLAILEPSEGGVAFESTDANGFMSGVLGGLAPGSYILECRAPAEFNLIARATVVISGTAPESFIGFPGAAGGNLGGGAFVVPDVDTGAVRITSIAYQDLGENTNFIDIVFTVDCDDTTDGDQNEPFFLNTYTLGLANDTAETVFVSSIEIEFGDGRGISVTQPVRIVIPATSTATYQGQLTDANPSVASSGKNIAGSAADVVGGTYPITFTITGTTAETGDSFTVAESQTASFGGINNCSAS